MLLTGSILDRAPGRRYTQTLRFAELNLRAPLPRANTLKSWRAGLPEGFALALRAPRAAVVSARGPLRPDAALEAARSWLLEAADALNVSAVVFPTPADFTPGARSRDLLQDYAKQLPAREGRHYVWSPSGIWEPEDTNGLCKQLDWVCAFDPLQNPRTAGPVVYAELRAMGHRSSFSPAVLEDALATILSEPTEKVFVTIDAPKSFDIAKRLQTIAAEQGIETFGHSGAQADADNFDEDDEDDDESDEDDADLEDADDDDDA